MPPTTSGGENAVFLDDVTQLEGGETEDACVAFSASNIWHSVQPGKTNPYTYEDIDRLAVKSREIDSPARQGHRADQSRERLMTRVWHSHAHADSGRSQFLPTQDCPDHTLHLAVGKLTGLVEAADHLPNRLLLAGRLQIDNDRIANSLLPNARIHAYAAP